MTAKRAVFAVAASGATAISSIPTTSTSSSSEIIPWTRDQTASTGSFCAKDHYTLRYKVSEGSSSAQYIIHFDSKTRNPKWVISYHPKESNVVGGTSAVRAKTSFHPDPRIDECFRVKSADYVNSGFDRGHMVPAADMAISQEAMQSTFTMANICPQAPTLNKGLWAKFEAFLRYQHERNDAFEEMMVITGPVYAPVKFGDANWMYMHKTVGSFPRLITVPTHFFKVVVVRKAAISSSSSNSVTSSSSSSSSGASSSTTIGSVLTLFGGSGTGSGGGSNIVVSSSSGSSSGRGSVGGDMTYIGAFLVPNSDDVDPKMPLGRFAVRLDQLEALVGWQFFPENILPGPDKNQLDTTLPSDHLDIETLLSPALFAKATTTTSTSTNNAITSTTRSHKNHKGSSSSSFLFQHLCKAPHVNCQASMFTKT